MNLNALVKKLLLNISGTNQQKFNQWIAAVKNQFKVNNADYNYKQRTH
jgi:hypothetical protein